MKQYFKSLDKYKKGFWIYLVLTFIEGAMRKWFMPGLSEVWMMCREPIVIWTVLSLMGSHYLKRSTVAIFFMSIGIFMFMTTMTMGHKHLGVALWGFRIWFFHLPYIFIMANKLNRIDLIKICQFIIIVFMPMTILFVVQWASPVNSWINARAGGVFANMSEDMLRPSGTFILGLGSSYYIPVVVSLSLATVFSPFYRKKLLVIKHEYLILILSVFIALIVSISRGAVIQSIVTALFIALILSLYGNSRYLSRFLLGLCCVYIIFYILSEVSINGKGLLDPITNRFETASEQQGGSYAIFDDRVLGPLRFWNISGNISNLPLFGYGIGAGSNYGTKYLNIGDAWGLGEWSSPIVTNEMGLLFGGIVFFMRLGFCFYLMPKCLRLIKKNNDILPLCLWTLSINYFSNGNINLTMTLGWIVIVMILLIVSIRTSVKINS